LHEILKQLRYYGKRALENPEFKMIIAFFCTICNQLFGSFNQPFRVLLVLIIVDLLTGIFKSIKYQKFASRPLRKSLWKFCEYMITIFIAHQVEMLGINGFRDLAIFWVGFTELTSINENLIELNVNIPNFIQKVLKKEKNKIEKR
jgi:toxin secretion/phage lysis holin